MPRVALLHLLIILPMTTVLPAIRMFRQHGKTDLMEMQRAIQSLRRHGPNKGNQVPVLFVILRVMIQQAENHKLMVSTARHAITQSRQIIQLTICRSVHPRIPAAPVIATPAFPVTIGSSAHIINAAWIALFATIPIRLG